MLEAIVVKLTRKSAKQFRQGWHDIDTPVIWRIHKFRRIAYAVQILLFYIRYLKPLTENFSTSRRGSTCLKKNNNDMEVKG